MQKKVSLIDWKEAIWGTFLPNVNKIKVKSLEDIDGYTDHTLGYSLVMTLMNSS